MIKLIFNNLYPNELESLAEHTYSYLYPLNDVDLPVLSSCRSYPNSVDYQDVPYDGEIHKNNIQKSLETIIEGKDSLEHFLHSKKEVLLDTAKGILTQIYERRAISEENLYEIDKRISRANSVLEQLRVFDLGTNPVIDKRKVFFEKELIGFEQEKRLEKVACWRDITRLKTQLLEIKQQIDTQTNRQKLIYG